jgi:hypothetical protein
MLWDYNYFLEKFLLVLKNYLLKQLFKNQWINQSNNKLLKFKKWKMKNKFNMEIGTFFLIFY